MWEFDYSKEELEECGCTIADVCRAREYHGQKMYRRNFMGEDYDETGAIYNGLSIGEKHALRLMADSGEID